MFAVRESGCICCHVSIHRQIHCSPLNDMPHYGMPEVRRRLANPGRRCCFSVSRLRPVKGEITALIQCLSDTGADPIIQAASLPATPRHPTHEHTPGTDTSCWPQLCRRLGRVCLYKCRHTFMHTQMVQVRIAQRNASVSWAVIQNHKSKGKHRY